MHSIAIQVPISAVTISGHPTIGVWTTASRQRVTLWDADAGETVNTGPCRQVSRLGNPLVNEVIIPLGKKDLWNSLPPDDDKQFAGYVTAPGLAGCCRSCTRAYSPTWPRWSRPASRAPTWRRSCSPAFRPG